MQARDSIGKPCNLSRPLLLSSLYALVRPRANPSVAASSIKGHGSPRPRAQLARKTSEIEAMDVVDARVRKRQATQDSQLHSPRESANHGRPTEST